MTATLTTDPLPLGMDENGDMTFKSTIWAFILGTICVFVTFPIGVVAIVLSNMGMERVATNRPLARKLVAWSWGIFVVTDTLIVIALIALILTR